MQLPPPSIPTTVDILLATYNGEKFLAQQIESLLAQTHTHWRLLVSDDGSSDTTPQIIKRFSAADTRIVLVNTARQGGVVANFQKALESASANYLMFCDQDDVWLEDKIEIMLAELMRREADGGDALPLLGFSDLKLVDSQLATLSDSFYGSNQLDPTHNLDSRYLAWSSTVYGCTTIFNAALLRLAMPVPAGVPMHDQWFALLAATHGAIFHVPQQTILYRQHDANVVGARRKSLLERVGAFRRTLGVIAQDIEKCMIQMRAARRIVSPVRPGKKAASDGLAPGAVEGFRARGQFVRNNVLPFYRERTVYAAMFSTLFLFHNKK